jgi:ferredoxin-NADP reductase
MSEHIVKVLEVEYITHDVKRIVVSKPWGYSFISGQATDVSVNKPGWANELRPFTFTSLNDWEYLEFMIKIYKDHPGVTNLLGKIREGDELILHDVFGAIQYKGPGVFIAGGAGITPFISIFRDLSRKNKLKGNKLFYSNKTSKDVILEDELGELLRDNFVKIFTRENVPGNINHRINTTFLLANIYDFGQHFYVCGPDSFVNDISDFLMDLSIKSQAVVIEQ